MVGEEGVGPSIFRFKAERVPRLHYSPIGGPVGSRTLPLGVAILALLRLGTGPWRRASESNAVGSGYPRWYSKPVLTIELPAILFVRLHCLSSLAVFHAP